MLLTDRAEIGLLADPALSNMLSKDFHLVGTMNAEIRKAVKLKEDAPIWYIGGYAHRSWIEQNPERAVVTMKMWQDAAAFYNEHPDEADEIVSEFTKIPVEALKLSRSLNLASFRVEPAIGQKANLQALFVGFKEVGFLEKLPDDGLYYDWAAKK